MLRPVLDVISLCGAFEQTIQPIGQTVQQMLFEDDAAQRLFVVDKVSPDEISCLDVLVLRLARVFEANEGSS